MKDEEVIKTEPCFCRTCKKVTRHIKARYSDVRHESYVLYYYVCKECCSITDERR